MLKLWCAIVKNGTTWGIIVAWCGTDLMWSLLELYSAVLHRLEFMNEIWTSASLIGTSVLTVICGLLADKIISCNPESYRYIRKIFDALGKVVAIILTIVLVRLQFNCEKWSLVMSIICILTAAHSLQFTGAFSNAIDIGDPHSGVTVSFALLLTSIGRLGMWNGLYYSVSMNMSVLTYSAPQYTICAVLAFGIIIFTMWGSPEVKLYLPPGWDIINDPQESDVKEMGCVCCPRRRELHGNIMKIMDEASRSLESHAASAFKRQLQPALEAAKAEHHKAECSDTEHRNPDRSPAPSHRDAVDGRDNYNAEHSTIHVGFEGYSRKPVTAVDGRDNYNAEQDAIHVGFEGYSRKPVTPEARIRFLDVPQSSERVRNPSPNTEPHLKMESFSQPSPKPSPSLAHPKAPKIVTIEEGDPCSSSSLRARSHLFKPIRQQTPVMSPRGAGASLLEDISAECNWLGDESEL